MLFQQIQSILKQRRTLLEATLFFLYLATAILFFGKGYRGELVDDGLAGLVKFENMGWHGFWQSFGFTSLYYFHDIFVLMVYKIVGKSTLGWFAVMVTLHSLNACLSFILFRKFYSLMGVARGTLIAFAGSMLFLLSPYQTENVLWAATLHYAIALAIFQASSIILLNVLQSGHISNRIIVLLGVLYCIALMTLEISLIFPFAYLVLGAGVILSKKSAVSLYRLITTFIFPLLCLIVLYFVITRIVKGHWIPHYGEAHLLNNDIKTYSTNYARYLIKTLGYVHFSQYHTRDLIYTFCEKWQLMLIIEVAVPMIVFLTLYARKKIAEANAFVLLAVLSFIMLLPSLHMFFMYLFNTENDRLGYFFLPFIYQVLPLLLVTLFSYLGMGLVLAFITVGIYFLHIQVSKWHEAGVIQDNCIHSFVWMDAPKIYVLNAPANYNGAYVFRNDGRLPYALNFFKRYRTPENIVQVLSSCYTGVNDSTIVEVVNDSTLHVMAKTGGWLMHEFVGATNYSTNEFEVRVDKWTPDYRVIFHTKQPGVVYIFSTPEGFKRVKNF